ncbi:unnamed protein product [Cunninghamella echinulata]
MGLNRAYADLTLYFSLTSLKLHLKSIPFYYTSNIPAIFVINQFALYLYASNHITGDVVDYDDTITHIVAIVGG